MTTRPLLLPAGFPQAATVIEAFDRTSGHAPMFDNVSVLPAWYVEAINLSPTSGQGGLGGGLDIASGRDVQWGSNQISVVDAGLGGRPALNFAAKTGDVRLHAPSFASMTVFFVASLAASQFSSSERSFLAMITDEEDGVSGATLGYQVFAPPITTNGGTQFSPDVAVGSNASNMDGVNLPAADTAAVWGFDFDSGSLVAHQYINSATAKRTDTLVAATPVSASAVWWLGSDPVAGGRGWLGRIACAVAYDSVLNSDDRATVIAALKARYSIA